jgi:hypothetical protein
MNAGEYIETITTIRAGWRCGNEIGRCLIYRQWARRQFSIVTFGGVHCFATGMKATHLGLGLCVLLSQIVNQLLLFGLRVNHILDLHGIDLVSSRDSVKICLKLPETLRKILLCNSGSFE